MCKCEHCNEEIRNGDTICIHCGESLYRPGKSFIPVILIGCVFWSVVAFIAYCNGWLA